MADDSDDSLDELDLDNIDVSLASVRVHLVRIAMLHPHLVVSRRRPPACPGPCLVLRACVSLVSFCGAAIVKSS